MTGLARKESARLVLPPNDMVRQLDAAYGIDGQLDPVLFLDGEERAGTASGVPDTRRIASTHRLTQAPPR